MPILRVYLKSQKFSLFLQTQRDFALNPACVCEISVIFFAFRYTLAYVIYAIAIKVFRQGLFSKRPENSRKESLQFEIPRQQQVQRGISIRDQALGLVQDGFFQRVTGHASVAIFGGVL